MRELQLVRSGRLAWGERAEPLLEDLGDAIVRPFLAGRCDGDTLPIHRGVSRAPQVGMALRLVDPVVGCICGWVPVRGPFAIGHECVAEVVEVGAGVNRVRVGERVVVPWAVSCGYCSRCVRGLTSKCERATDRTLAAFGFGPASGPWSADDRRSLPGSVRRPHARPGPGGHPVGAGCGGERQLGGRAALRRAAAREAAGRVGASPRGGARSIGLYAAGLAIAHGAGIVDYVDDSARRREIAELFGVRTRRWRTAGRANRRDLTRDPRRRGRGYDVVVEATSRSAGLRQALRALGPGGVCTAVGYYLASGTRVPAMRMYATSATLRVGVSHARAVLPELVAFVERTEFPAERVTTLAADWEEAPRAYAARTTKVVLQSDPLSWF